MDRDAVRAFSNVQGGVNYAQAAKNILTGQTGNSSESNPAPVTPKKQTTVSVAAGTSVSPDAATGTVAAGAPIAVPTTLQTVTQTTTTVANNHGNAGGPNKQVVSKYCLLVR